MHQHGRPEDTEVKRNLSKRGNVGAIQWDKMDKKGQLYRCTERDRDRERDEIRKKKNPKCGNLAATGRDRNRSESLGG